MRPSLKKAFVVVSISSRVDALNKMIETLETNIHDFPEWEICVLFQDNLGVADRINKKNITHLYIEKDLMGCNYARVELLRRIKQYGYDVYCNLDDDIEITPYTNYDSAVAKCLESGTGFVLTNWTRTEKILEQKIPKISEKFVPQALIYQGGGMLYNDIIADLVRTKVPCTKTVFDEGWPLIAYINGYTNYRYLGSLAIHRICTTGGMNEFYKSVSYDDLPNLFPEYIDYKKGKNGHWNIPLDADLTEKARTLHKERFKGKQ